MELMPIRVKFRGETPDLEIAPESFLRFEIDLGHGATAWIERVESVWYINDEPAARVLVMGGGAVRSFHPESGNTMLITALERQRSKQERHEGFEPRECVACGDDVLTLSSDGLCDGCVEEGTRRNRPDVTQPPPATLPYTSSRYDGWGVRPLDKHDPDL